MHTYHFLTPCGIVELQAPNILEAIAKFRHVLPDMDYYVIKQLPSAYKLHFAVGEEQLN